MEKQHGELDRLFASVFEHRPLFDLVPGDDQAGEPLTGEPIASLDVTTWQLAAADVNIAKITPLVLRGKHYVVVKVQADACAARPGPCGRSICSACSRPSTRPSPCTSTRPARVAEPLGKHVRIGKVDYVVGPKSEDARRSSKGVTMSQRPFPPLTECQWTVEVLGFLLAAERICANVDRELGYLCLAALELDTVRGLGEGP